VAHVLLRRLSQVQIVRVIRVAAHRIASELAFHAFLVLADAGCSSALRSIAPAGSIRGNLARVDHGGGAAMLPAGEYVASLARKRMAAGALFRDGTGRVLLVDPVYRDTWDLPGGAVEAEESPHTACRREVAEELGLDRPVGRILAVDWVPSRPERPEGLVVVYDGGVLAPADIDGIMVPDGELAGFAFILPDAVAELVTPLVGRRIAACLEALASGTVASLEGGSQVG
jgi:8-oxo-dGTP diphosphatase